MTTLPGTYMPNRPTELRVTILDTPQDLLWYHLDGGILEDADGNVTLADPAGAITVPLKGLYRVQRLENGIPVARPGRLLTKEQFEAGLTEFEEPYFEYGVKFLPRRNDVVEHGSLDRAKAALIDAPILRASGEYGIVRRLIHEPGAWELVPDVTFDGDETA
jgi:hypothetical protein